MHQLSLPTLLATLALLCGGCAWAIVALVNAALRWFGRDVSAPLPLRESVVGAAATLFGLMIAFSAAGIWADSARARAAVERETDALENVVALAGTLPAPSRDAVRGAVAAYAREVVARDWPRMREGAGVDDPAYIVAEKALIDALTLAAEAGPPEAAGVSRIVTQLLDARAARSQRLLVAASGMSRAQWTSVIVIACLTVLAIGLVNAHSRRSQLVATQVAAALVAAVAFAIVAHDRPFAGSISIGPAPFERIAAP